MRRALLLLGAIAAAVLAPAVALAHPLGNFTVNASAGIVLSPGTVRVDYVLDMAEIPTVQAMPTLDADGDGTVSSAEAASWASDRAPELLAGLTLTVDGEPVALHVSGAHLELLPGQGGLSILRLEAAFDGATTSEGELSFHDANYADRIGWHEVTAAGVGGVAVRGSSVPAASPSDRLRSYPRDLLSSPLDVREAGLRFAPGRSISVPTSGPDAEGSSARPGVVGGAFANLVERTGPLMIVALLLAFAFGALHALGPGHGKTLMGAYLVGAGGRARVAVAVGGAVAVMHTASVLALGFVVLTATTVFAPERVYPWLGLASGLIALGLGASLLVARLGAWGDRGPESDDGEHERGTHDHPHGTRDHSHPHAPALSRPVLSARGLTALAVAGGILPSPTALVVLLASVALHRVGYGLALIGAFSLGLAAALVAVGMLALRARDVVERRMSGRVARLMPIASAVAIAMLGLVLTVSGAARI
jgi:ABC-type nickel/cobalt efflux system permease component RcnA